LLQTWLSFPDPNDGELFSGTEFLPSLEGFSVPREKAVVYFLPGKPPDIGPWGRGSLWTTFPASKVNL